MSLRIVKRVPTLLLSFVAAVVISVALLAGVFALSSAGAAPLAQPGAAAIRWGFYVTYNPNSLQSLQANVNKLNYVSPWYFNLNSSGQVTGNDQADVSQLIKSAGAKNLPMIKNSGAEYDVFSGILGDDSKVASIVNSIDSLVSANGYDGI